MPWIVGIDEAGYGPNLGPLVQVCIAIYQPVGQPVFDWHNLKNQIRKADEKSSKNDTRYIVDDSKKVYSAGQGWDQLTRTVQAILPYSFAELIQQFSVGERTIEQEFWYVPEGISQQIEAVRREPPFIDRSLIRVMIYCTATNRFNQIVDQHQSKANVVMDRISTFFQESLKLGKEQAFQEKTSQGKKNDSVMISCDKLGGRNFYGPLLLSAFPESWPIADVESANESRYRVTNIERDLTVTFKPRADGESLSVALASMLAKYVREICMAQFNAYWQQHLPDLKPTAGYPVDAKRYFAAIEPFLANCALKKEDVWRKK